MKCRRKRNEDFGPLVVVAIERMKQKCISALFLRNVVILLTELLLTDIESMFLYLLLILECQDAIHYNK